MEKINDTTATRFETSGAEEKGDIQMLDKTFENNAGLQVFASNIHAITDHIDPHAEKRLVRKIDFYVIPLICVTYLVTYIDKATLSYGSCNLSTILHVVD
jgi:hypothetical protein